MPHGPPGLNPAKPVVTGLTPPETSPPGIDPFHARMNLLIADDDEEHAILLHFCRAGELRIGIEKLNASGPGRGSQTAKNEGTCPQRPVQQVGTSISAKSN